MMRLILFDLDNTLLDGDSDFAWAQFLIQKGALERQAQEERNQRFLADYEAGTLDIEAFLNFQLAPLAAHSRATLEAWRAEYVKESIRPMMSLAARTLVRDHLAEKDGITILVTATNSFVTAPIAREFGFAHLIATIPECINGEFTGKVKGIPAFREGKLVRVEAWLEAQALHWGSFAESRFYSDSQNDLPLLEKVSHPIAVNPDPHLFQVATARKWGILQLRHNNKGSKPL
ncbi:MAG: HAD-IB family hydrolase [Zoogloeaceae bacterium]|jgi:HAD superfamily hydrolase (TIGR01490 family)|nr:HAD-IB family hydrolase [Zoogloeaceae bacterium]